jgi:predicted RNase H-like HicB family nuclease
MNWDVMLEPDPDTGDWAIWCPELPGCTSAGETEGEALENIKEAIQFYLQPESIRLAPGAIAREITF